MKTKHKKRENLSSLHLGIIFLIIAIGIELFVLNFGHFRSLTFGTEMQAKFISSENMSTMDGDVIITPKEEDSDLKYVEITGIHKVVNNVYLNLIEVRTESEEDTDAEFTITIYAKDEGNAVYYKLPDKTIKLSDIKSQYIKLNLSGEAESLKIYFNDFSSGALQINEIILNTRVPLVFSIFRTFCMLIGIIILYLFRPGSVIYNETYNFDKTLHKLFVMGILYLQIILMMLLIVQNPKYRYPPWKHHYQYEKLAVALSEGHFYLEDEPTEELKSLGNPYDNKLRKQEKVKFLWDHAYYNGHYYVYFGVVPVLIFYLPYYLVTGNGFPTVFGIFISGILFATGLMILIHALVRRYFKKTSLGTLLLLDILAFLACGALNIANIPVFYSLPIILGLAFTVWGLYFWLIAIAPQKKKLYSVKEEHFYYTDSQVARRQHMGVNIKLCIGSLFMALVAGCRPQLLLASFFALPMFGPRFVKGIKVKGMEKEKKEIILNIISFSLPYIIVAAFLMYYNYARFGSPLDFGANYNLTTNDMTHREFKLDRIPLGIFTFLFQPLNIVGEFPFLSNVNFTTIYQGTTIYEKMYGGLFMLNPTLLSGLFFYKVKDKLKEKGLKAIVIMSLIFALIVVIADTQMAGILPRYYSDFGIFLSIPMVCVILSLFEEGKSKIVCQLLNKALYICGVITVIIALLWIFAAS